MLNVSAVLKNLTRRSDVYSTYRSLRGLQGAAMIEAGQHEGQSPDAKLMRLRYAGSCETCNATLSAGTTAWYDRSRRKVRCQSCLP